MTQPFLVIALHMIEKTTDRGWEASRVRMRKIFRPRKGENEIRASKFKN